MLEAIVNLVFEMGYLGFFLYMIVVGTFVLLPTQLILIPAGYLVVGDGLVVILVISFFIYREFKSY